MRRACTSPLRSRYGNGVATAGLGSPAEVTDWQELSTSTGTYSPCSMKATKDSADVVYRVGLHRAKRFNVRIVQADTATFTLESCHKLNVRTGPGHVP